jgi:hypothetical protein
LYRAASRGKTQSETERIKDFPGSKLHRIFAHPSSSSLSFKEKGEEL